jgi:hypothetical protein
VSSDFSFDADAMSYLTQSKVSSLVFVSIRYTDGFGLTQDLQDAVDALIGASKYPFNGFLTGIFGFSSIFIVLFLFFLIQPETD